MSDIEEKLPQVGEQVLFQDDEEEYAFATITEVGDFDDDTGLYSVETDQGPFTIYWSEDDENWVHSEE